MSDLLVIGSGVAGLSAAVRAAALGSSVTICTKGALAASATWYAQGGVAAALSDVDSAALHAHDTMNAGAGLCDPEAVAVLVAEGPDRIRSLIDLGAEFDRTADAGAAGLAFTREGGHSVARVVHAGGDATGAEIERALVAAVRVQPVTVYEYAFVFSLLTRAGRVAGALVQRNDGTIHEVEAEHIVMATGGAGQCYAVTTNPVLSTGDGIALAGRIGAALADLEFMQFHPTALDVEAMPRALLSEALRGEGAVLRTASGDPFMAEVHPRADLAPRDVVARAITERSNAGVRVLLDATAIPHFARRFPTVAASCRAVGLDPQHDWLPVAPAAHYLSGGIATDLDGASSVPRLWACGEVACSGVHGANRLASNSLLDGLVFGTRAADAIGRGKTQAEATGVLRGFGDPVAEPVVAERAVSGAHAGSPVGIDDARPTLQAAMTRNVGVLRTAEGLKSVAEFLDTQPGDEATSGVTNRAVAELTNLTYVARRIVRSATARRETRGTHTRTDAPETLEAFRGRFVHTGDVCTFVPLAPMESP